MPASRKGSKVTNNFLYLDVAAFSLHLRFDVPVTAFARIARADPCGSDVTALRDQHCAAPDFLRLDVASAGLDLYVVACGNSYLEVHPELRAGAGPTRGAGW